MARLSASQRKLLDDGKALVAHCPLCQHEMFLGGLPMDAAEVVKATKVRCPNAKSHKVFMGPLPA